MILYSYLVILMQTLITPIVPYSYFASEYLHNEKFNANQRQVDVEVVPHHVLVYYEYYYCSGSIISSRTVLTCATCFYKLGEVENKNIFVNIGTNYVISQGKVLLVIEVKIHEFYQRLSHLDNDIALLFLEGHVEFSNKVRKGLVLSADLSLREDTRFHVTGFSDKNITLKYAGSGRLIYSTFTLVDRDTCREAFGGIMTQSNFCAKFNPDQRLGDNGGGALIKDTLVGILSYGGISTTPPHLAIFTNVSYFNRWMKLNIQRLSAKYCVVEKEITRAGRWASTITPTSNSSDKWPGRSVYKWFKTIVQ